MPDMEYEELETQLAPGDAVLFYSDGLVEAHNAHREMFSFPRLRDLMAHHDMSTTEELVDFLLGQLAQFTGPDWEQEDDITLVTLARVRNVARLTSFATDMLDQDQEVEDDHSGSDEGLSMQRGGEAWKTLIEFSVPSAPGNERGAMERVQDAVKPLGLHTRTVEKLGTAVSEATMNAMEHGNKYQPELLVALRVEVSSKSVRVGITDQGDPIPLNSEEPDLELKLAGMQTPRGWGMFLIKNMVDDMRVADDESGHTLELTIHREGANRVE
jgi:anti-sigma regulatory factor (Ser/Thr protein kinase)